MILKKWMKSGLLAIGLSIGLTGSASALSPSDQEGRALISKIERYMGDLTTVRSRFIQTNHDGSYAEGTMLLNLPGKMRFEYDPPVPVLMVSDGRFLIHYDKELEEVMHIPLISTPAYFLLRDNPTFDGDVSVTDIRSQNGLIQINVVEKDNEDAGQVSMIFTESPFQLRQWVVTDLQGLQTQVTLTDAEFNIPLDRDLFFFVDRRERERD